ncbi:Spy/CpxP family protein refolding chaperone [Planctobacterium marinum]|uniref:Spy/CpxP family protein refolding chaperone n=1 Tax=Planctobacterium marinum TaxID=1631968 RepID=UPI001E5F1583|nr:Spy/CpxP family protein refolding chaperone [Planctobacterium marinum]MCC2607821.1 Spy/CpxP family protein refolding chaperone [Planctobacterium marinum]
MTLRKFVTTVVGVSVLATGLAFAHEKGEHDRHGPRKEMRQFFKQLDLEREQKQAIRSVMHDAKDTMSLYREDMKKLQEEALNLIDSGNVTQESIASLLAQYETTLTAMAVAKADKKYAVYQVLTEAQREKAEALMADKSPRRGKGDPQTRFERLADKLALSDEQKAQVEPLLEQAQASKTALREQVQGFREELKSWMQEGSYSSDKVSALFSASFPEFQASFYAVVADHQQVYQLLTEEQQAKLQKRGRHMFLPRMI